MDEVMQNLMIPLSAHIKVLKKVMPNYLPTPLLIMNNRGLIFKTPEEEQERLLNFRLGSSIISTAFTILCRCIVLSLDTL